MSQLYSHDLIARILVDKIGETFIPKKKIVFGVDGAYTDVTSSTPFPVIDQNAADILTQIYNELVAFHFDNTTENEQINSSVTGFQASNTSENLAIYSAVTGFEAQNSVENALLFTELQEFHADNTSENTAINSVLTTINGKIANNYGAATGAIRTASQIGNTTGAADFAAGNSSAQTLRTVIATDQSTLAVTFKDALDADFGTITNPIYISAKADTLDPFAAFVARSNKVLAANTTSFDTFTMVNDIALIDFHFGGRGPGQASVYKYVAATTEQVPGGGFNSSADVALWTNAGAGSSAGLTWSYTTAQSVQGTGSATVTFTQSDTNNFPALRYTYATPKDLSGWQFISGWGRVTVAAGGAQTRAIQIILTDVNAATRTYQITGTTNTPPFNTEQWLNILKAIDAPDASTGTFDVYNVSTVTLKLLDGGNKAGTIYWDDIEFIGQKTLIERIYVDSNRTFQLILNPAELFSIGEVLALEYRNNDTVSREFTVTAKGAIA